MTTDFQGNGFFPDDVHGKMEKYLYLKMYFGNFMSHVGPILSIIGNVSAMLALVKLLGWWNIPVIITVIVGGIVFSFWAGSLLFRKNVAQREQVIQARYNPPIQQILDNSKK